MMPAKMAKIAIVKYWKKERHSVMYKQSINNILQKWCHRAQLSR